MLHYFKASFSTGPELVFLFQQDNLLCVAEGEDPTDPLSELDPERNCSFYNEDGQRQKFAALATCKDNCRGGKTIKNKTTTDEI